MLAKAASSIALLALLTSLTTAQTISISDGEFSDVDWDERVAYTTGGGGSVSAFQAATGGNPGNHRRVEMTTSAGSSTVSSSVWVFHRYLPRPIDPAVDGPIATISMTVDVRRDSSPFSGAGQGLTMAVEQGGVVFRSGFVLADTFLWNARTIDATSVQSFVELGGSGARPDFGATGAPFHLGFVTVNSTGVGGSGYTSDVLYDNIAYEVRIASDTTRYDCVPSVPNSSNRRGSIYATGSVIASSNALTLHCVELPVNTTVLFLCARQSGFVAGPGGSQGNLCLGGPIGRFSGPGQIGNSGSAGSDSLAIDLTRLPTPTGLAAGLPGETWHFQAWHRDSDSTPTSNFTNAMSITLQ